MLVYVTVSLFECWINLTNSILIKLLFHGIRPCYFVDIYFLKLYMSVDVTISLICVCLTQEMEHNKSILLSTQMKQQPSAQPAFIQMKTFHDNDQIICSSLKNGNAVFIGIIISEFIPQFS